ncbi:uncharacterized protein BHQ10_008229 [Talaromyces amestolkiae]|uniref:Uncharacterized protein n=1 Tax=Talaromyces amestolkiae TaxID=1196081 RepID=A0A364L8T3_TALAM|nr:uncharacterized protein BHQ10_008229 [Talaromyces amestolkiae]RAO72217.1 hypothetical protein BHQ10_008229 [Talaromyces amestolkiae]
MIMAPLTAKALSDQEEFYARERVEIVQSHAAKVIQEEQIQKYLSQRGIAEGYDIMAGEGVRVSRLGGHEYASFQRGGGITSRGTATQRDSGIRDNNGDSWNSLKLFMPRQPPTRGHEQPYETSGATPLERYLTPGASSDPSYIRRPAMMQAKCYGDMGSVESRAHQAQALADKVDRDGQARNGGTRDGFVYK